MSKQRSLHTKKVVKVHVQLTQKFTTSSTNPLPENKDECEDEAIKLAMDFNFICDLTSMVIEESNKYLTIGKGIYIRLLLIK